MSYGLILYASSLKLKKNQDDVALNLYEKSLNWIVNNSDINGNGIVGYGLADSFDAFSDNSINPPHTEYTITNGIVLQGLLESYDLAPDDIKISIRSIVEELIQTYLNGYYNTPGGFISYSISQEDKGYVVYNPAIYMAGVLQYYSNIFPESEISVQCGEFADNIVSFMLSKRKESSSGGYYWNYGENQERPNDLVHACYIIEGFRVYAENNGAIDVPMNLLYMHLLDFKQDSIFNEHPIQRGGILDNSPRLWSLGMLLYTLDLKNDLENIGLVNQQLACYQNDENLFQCELNDPRIINRHLAHLLLGLWVNDDM
jgi:hypothetical protein